METMINKETAQELINAASCMTGRPLSKGYCDIVVETIEEHGGAVRSSELLSLIDGNMKK